MNHRLDIIQSLVDLVLVWALAFALMFPWYVWDRRAHELARAQQFRIYEDFIVKCLNGGAIINGRGDSTVAVDCRAIPLE